MHIPSVFTEDHFDSIINFIAAKPLATIVAQTKNGIEACHIPLFWYDNNSQHGCLYGHFGRKNPIYQDALPDTSWLIIFQDTGHYISPNWYPSKAKTQKEVPADYIEAMCRGIIGFRLTIDAIQAQFKLSQNKTAENITGVINGLELLKTNDAAEMAITVANHNNQAPF